MRVTCFIRYEIAPFQRSGLPRRANFEMARHKRFILREERSFLQAVPETLFAATREQAL